MNGYRTTDTRYRRRTETGERGKENGGGGWGGQTRVRRNDKGEGYIKGGRRRVRKKEKLKERGGRREKRRRRKREATARRKTVIFKKYKGRGCYETVPSYVKRGIGGNPATAILILRTYIDNRLVR